MCVCVCICYVLCIAMYLNYFLVTVTSADCRKDSSVK